MAKKREAFIVSALSRLSMGYRIPLFTTQFVLSMGLPFIPDTVLILRSGFNTDGLKGG